MRQFRHNEHTGSLKCLVIGVRMAWPRMQSFTISKTLPANTGLATNIADTNSSCLLRIIFVNCYHLTSKSGTRPDAKVGGGFWVRKRHQKQGRKIQLRVYVFWKARPRNTTLGLLFAGTEIFCTLWTRQDLELQRKRYGRVAARVSAKLF